MTKMLIAAIAVAPSYPLACRCSSTERSISGLDGVGIGAALFSSPIHDIPPPAAEWGWSDYGRRACVAYY